MQPAYLPWMGFFDLMDQVDEFIILDDVQFEKQSWQNRNRIKSRRGETFLTVPIRRTGLDTLIQDAQIDYHSPWQKKHLQTLLECYAKTPHIQEYKDWLESIYAKPVNLLRDLNNTIIDDIAKKLGISVRISKSSELTTTGHKVEKLLNICKTKKADTYISPVGAFGYITEDNRFAEHGIRLEYQHFDHPVYKQLHDPFISHLSVVDLLFNEGNQSMAIIRSGRKTPMTHEELAKQKSTS